MIFLLACVNPKNTGYDSGLSSSSCSSIDLSSDASFDSSCQEFDGVAVPGSTSYFLGDLCLSGTSVGSQVTGSETWLLIANDAWIASGQDTCTVVWNSIGVVTEPSGCPTCTIGLEITASVDRERSDCPVNLYSDDETLQEQYDVFIKEDGSLDWFFSGSGNRFASGVKEGGSISYISDSTCKWF
ncbi:MAG: hypothetical protein CMK59_05980 [Proteobacteria bacterium]|nr:hypothetical protein [Pseudomonadota bacterium]